jgi:PAS domain S-box-containing protein
MLTRSTATSKNKDVIKHVSQQDLVGQRDEDYRSIIERLPAAIYTTDRDGFVTMYNAAAAQLWGREPVLLKDKWCGSWKIFNPDGTALPLSECPMAITLSEGRACDGYEIIVERPDGVRRHVMPHPQPIFDESGHLTGAMNMLVDITESRRAEIALREVSELLEKKVVESKSDLGHKIEELRLSEEHYHKMIEEVEDYAILRIDPSGVIQNWNKGAEKIKGYTEEEIVGKNFRLFYLPEDRDSGLADQLIAEATLHGKALHEGWRMRKDGSVFWGSVVITALHDSNGNIAGFVKMTRDLTERKLAEDKIRQYTSELEFQNRELEQFAYAAAHDMKEPLRKIRFYTTLVFDNSADLLPEKEKDYLNRSINAAARMQTLIDDLLTYSKTSATSQDRKKVDLGKVVADIQVTHYDIIRELGAEIETGTLPVIEGVPFQISQLFDNLLGNALKYHHPERKPYIRVFSEKIKGRDLRFEQADKKKVYHKITIADNGIGFDPMYSDRIFDLFQRLHDKVTYTGTGIGLALCRKIVQNHNGFISATGEEGNGASFIIYFPAVTDL